MNEAVKSENNDPISFGIVDNDGYDKNPYWNRVKIIPGYKLKEFKGRYNKRLPLIPDDASADGQLVYAVKEDMDKANHAKVYIPNFELLNDLSSGELQLFTHIVCNCIDYDSDLFELNIKQYILDKEVSRSVAYKALQGLEDKEFIARKRNTKVFFYLNPVIVFKGLRRRGYNRWKNSIKLNNVQEL